MVVDKWRGPENGDPKCLEYMRLGYSVETSDVECAGTLGADPSWTTYSVEVTESDFHRVNGRYSR